MATIGDVAARAGVSTATVSRVLNGKGSVDPVLAERVKHAAAELAYQPHGPARNLRRRSTTIIAVIVPDIRQPCYAALSRGVEDAAHGAGYSVVLGNSDDDPAKESRYLDVAARENVAGVVLCSTSGTAASAALGVLLDRGTPVVAVGAASGDPRCDHILIDHGGAAREAVRHLRAQGYRSIGCLRSAAPSAAEAAFVADYRAEVGEADRRELPVTAAEVARALPALLRGPGRPDAVLVAAAALMPPVLGTLAAHGVRIGADLGLVGYADALPAEPGLSVLADPGQDAGAAAIRRMVARLTGGSRAAAPAVVRPALLAGGPTAEDFRQAHEGARAC